MIGNKSKKKQRSDKDEILESIHKLGFEVGYFRHNEDGWVGRKYRELLNLAEVCGGNIDIEGYYEAAKQEGRGKRRQDIAKGLSQKSEDINEEPLEKVEVAFSETDRQSADMKLSGKSVVELIDFKSPVEKSEITSKPDVIKKEKVLNAPRFL